jgi:trehalose synthase
MLKQIPVQISDPARYRGVIGDDRFEEVERAADDARTLLAGRVVWNVNSTAHGGGVVELLRPLLGYARGLGVDARWAVIDGDPAFYQVTKRIHNRLHGFDSDSGRLDEPARRIYEETLAANAAALAQLVRPRDVVILHDPQTVGLAPALRPLADAIIWRCHVGVDRPNDLVRDAWSFLRPYVDRADVCVFSREAFVWEALDPERIVIITPTIDAFTPKNEDLTPETVLSILRASALVTGPAATAPVTFRRQDGTMGRVEHKVALVEDQPLHAETPIAVQVSRWDALKDPIGVINGFARHVPAETGCHLVYAGPSVDAVADDPEGVRVLHDSVAARSLLPDDARHRIHLATLPMTDPDENAIVVNALQRHARVVVQKSIAEGFGLTVTEAMWKGRPVVASKVGGIEDQIVAGESGILLDDPRDLKAFGTAIAGLLAQPQHAKQLGLCARERVRDRFLSLRSLLDYLTVIRSVLDDSSRPIDA